MDICLQIINHCIPFSLLFLWSSAFLFTDEKRKKKTQEHTCFIPSVTMPVWFAKSRAISHHLNRKVGFMGILHQKFWTSSCSRHPSSLSSIFIPAGIDHEDHPTPHVFPFNSSITTRFSLRRFKSTKAASQLEQLYSTDDDDHDTSQVNLISNPYSLVGLFIYVLLFFWSWIASFYPIIECWAYKTILVPKHHGPLACDYVQYWEKLVTWYLTFDKRRERERATYILCANLKLRI